jgi:hypothetical protein
MNQQKPAKSGIALAALIIAGIALLMSAVPIINNFAFFLAAISLILGITGVILSKKTRAGRGKAIAGIILSVLATVIVFASQSFYGSVLDTASTELNETIDKSSGDATEELLKNDVTVVMGTFAATTDEYGIVTTELPVTVTNKHAEKKSYSIHIEAIGADGARIVDETVYANDLGTGQTQQLKAFTYVALDKVEVVKTATFKIVTVSQY